MGMGKRSIDIPLWILSKIKCVCFLWLSYIYGLRSTWSYYCVIQELRLLFSFLSEYFKKSISSKTHTWQFKYAFKALIKDTTKSYSKWIWVTIRVLSNPTSKVAYIMFHETVYNVFLISNKNELKAIRNELKAIQNELKDLIKRKHPL